MTQGWMLSAVWVTTERGRDEEKNTMNEPRLVLPLSATCFEALVYLSAMVQEGDARPAGVS